MGGKTRIRDMKNSKNINIPLNISEDFFKALRIDPTQATIRDVKIAIFKFYSWDSPDINFSNRKTLSQQKPNNAYSVPITDNELRLFMKFFDFDEEDFFQEKIYENIIRNILLKC
jgi:hypothetical protein